MGSEAMRFAFPFLNTLVLGIFLKSYTYGRTSQEKEK